MLTIATVLWRGDFRPMKYSHPGYNPRWVQKICNMVARNLKMDYEFVCLSNENFKIDGGRVIRLKYNFPGWWSKMELFRDDLPVSDGTVLYVDLDSLIVSDITPLLDYKKNKEMVICPPFGQYKDSWKEEGKVFGYNSSVMRYRKPMSMKIWDRFMDNPQKWMKSCRGDQDFLKVAFPDIEVYPSKWIRKLGSFVDKDSGRLARIDNSGAKIVLCMPTKNRNAARRYSQIRKIWR